MSKQPSFRQRVINRIRRDGIDMQFWTHEEAQRFLSAEEQGCGTSCCLAGNIALEAGAKTAPGTSSRVIVPLTSENMSVEAYARKVWAQHYGDKEAKRLDFMLKSEAQHLHDVLPSQVVQHLKDIRVR